MYLDAPMVGSFVYNVHVFVLFQCWLYVMKGKVVDHSCIFITVFNFCEAMSVPLYLITACD